MAAVSGRVPLRGGGHRCLPSDKCGHAVEAASSIRSTSVSACARGRIPVTLCQAFVHLEILGPCCSAPDVEERHCLPFRDEDLASSQLGSGQSRTAG